VLIPVLRLSRPASQAGCVRIFFVGQLLRRRFYPRIPERGRIGGGGDADFGFFDSWMKASEGKTPKKTALAPPDALRQCASGAIMVQCRIDAPGIPIATLPLERDS